METCPELSQPLAALSSHDQIPEDVQDVLPFVEEETEAPIAEPVKKKRGGHAQSRTAELGTDPRAKRAQIRSSMRPGYYLCYSGKKNVKTLLKLGLVTLCLGNTFPSVASLDTICKLSRRNLDNPDEN